MKNKDFWIKKAQGLKIETRAFIAGKYVPALSGKTFPAINPATGQEIAQVASCHKEDVDSAVSAARRAFEDRRWSGLAPQERKTILLKLAELIEKHHEEFALLETLNMGKPISYSYSGDIPGSVNCLRWNAEAIDKVYDQVAPTPDTKLAMVRRAPLGVIGAIIPWNYPLMMAMWKIAPCLATGNSLILKPAEQSPLSAIRLGALAKEAGVPDGVLNIIPGYGETAGQAIGRHMDIDCLAFTGSGEVGKLLMTYAGESNMKHVSLECGGKTPHIIMADCEDLDNAAEAAARGIFENQGEVCNAGSRLLVEESIAKPFLDKVLEHTKDWRVGDPMDPDTNMGPLVTKEQMDRVMSYIHCGDKEGAKKIVGGKQVMTESGGYYVEPTIFEGVTSKMTIAQEEIFGPVLAYMTFNGEEEAVKLANDTVYGLAAAVWTRDASKALRMATRIQAGSIWINCFDEGNITVPFGGFKQSGFGRDKSLYAFEKYTDLKTIWMSMD